MSYVFQEDLNPITGMPYGGMDPYDSITNPYGLHKVPPLSQAGPPPPPPIQMQGAGLPSLGDPGPFGFTPQPTGGADQLAGLMAMQQAQFAPLLAGPPTTTTTETGTGTGTGTGTTTTTKADTETGTGGGGEYSGSEVLDPSYDAEAIQNLINEYIKNNPESIIQDWMRNNPEGIGSLDLGQYGVYDNYYTQDDINDLLEGYTANENIIPADYSNYVLNTDVNKLLEDYTLTSEIPATDYTGYYTQSDIDKLLEDYTLTSNIPAVDYSGYYDQAYIDNLLQGINGLQTPNPGARRSMLVQE
tara:strand:- start:3358 stop:4260 length:903 start_codon:yes stop_codon:yes gene_type:complete